MGAFVAGVKRRTTSTGLYYMLVAAFFFSIMTLLVKLVGHRIPTIEIVFFRSIIALVISYLALRQLKINIWGEDKRVLLLRGAFGFGALCCVVYSITVLPLADATVIQFTNPVFTAILSAVFLKEPIRRRDIALGVMSLSGVILVARPSFLFGDTTGPGLDGFAVAIALLGAIFSAAAYTSVRKLKDSDHYLVVVFYFPLVATPAALPLLVQRFVWPSAIEWLILLGIGIVVQIAQVFMTRGLHIETAGRATSINYVQIVLAILWGALLFGEMPHTLGLCGATMIVAGTFGLLRR